MSIVDKVGLTARLAYRGAWWSDIGEWFTRICPGKYNELCFFLLFLTCDMLDFFLRLGGRCGCGCCCCCEAASLWMWETMSGTLEVVALALSWTVVVEMEDERVLVAADEDEPWRRAALNLTDEFLGLTKARHR